MDQLHLSLVISIYISIWKYTCAIITWYYMLHKNKYLRLADHLSEKSSGHPWKIHRQVSQNSLAPNSDQIGGLLTLHDKPIGETESCVCHRLWRNKRNGKLFCTRQFPDFLCGTEVLVCYHLDHIYSIYNIYCWPIQHEVHATNVSKCREIDSIDEIDGSPWKQNGMSFSQIFFCFVKLAMWISKTHQIHSLKPSTTIRTIYHEPIDDDPLCPLQGPGWIVGHDSVSPWNKSSINRGQCWWTWHVKFAVEGVEGYFCIPSKRLESDVGSHHNLKQNGTTRDL